MIGPQVLLIFPGLIGANALQLLTSLTVYTLSHKTSILTHSFVDHRFPFDFYFRLHG